jgi:hypothetical protein
MATGYAKGATDGSTRRLHQAVSVSYLSGFKSGLRPSCRAKPMNYTRVISRVGGVRGAKKITERSLIGERVALIRKYVRRASMAARSLAPCPRRCSAG